MVTDRIEIRGLRVLAICGVLPEERDRPQPFEIHLDIEADLDAATRSDALEDTIDYGAVCDAVAELARGARFDLMEAFAGSIIDRVLADQPAALAVEATVRKLRPPVALHLATAAIRIRRAR